MNEALAKDVNDGLVAKGDRYKISLNLISSTICSGLTWHIEDKRAIVLFSNLPDARQSSPVWVRTQQLTPHSLGRRYHRSLFVMLFETDPKLHDRPCPSCE